MDRNTKKVFESRIIHGPNCWLWAGSINPNQPFKRPSYGYGVFTMNQTRYLAHRFSYELYVGPIPPGLCVCHHCDNRLCVRPSHLFIGTRIDNNVDRDKKGRQAKGEKRPHKLTESQVFEIRRIGKAATRSELSRRYGVSRIDILRILQGKIWKHLPLH